MNKQETADIGEKLAEVFRSIRSRVIDEVAPILAQKADGSYRDAMNEVELALPKIDKISNEILIERILAVATPEELKRAQPWLALNKK